MPRFAANLNYLFQELPLARRFAAAAGAGFRGVELLFPYEQPAARLAGWLRDSGLEPVLLNLPAGDWAAGERGTAALPGREPEFRDGLLRALDYATALGCRRLHALAGVVPAGTEPAACESTYRANLGWAAEAALDAGIALCIEPINRRDIPGYFLRDTGHARAVIGDVGAANLKLQFDVYHVQIIEGDLSRRLEECLPILGHVQIAAPPDRAEPDHGEVAFPWLFALLDRLGYDGWIGCEYRPRGDTLEGLRWARPYGIDG